MSNIKFGSQVYTWFMQETGKGYDNKLDHMIKVAAEAGFKSIEPMVLEISEIRSNSKTRSTNTTWNSPDWLWFVRGTGKKKHPTKGKLLISPWIFCRIFPVP